MGVFMNDCVQIIVAVKPVGNHGERGIFHTAVAETRLNYGKSRIDVVSEGLRKVFETFGRGA